jgi:hypothetical protein
MGKTADRMTEQAEEQAAALLSEPVLGVAYANQCGVMGTIVARTALNIADALVPGEIGSVRMGTDHIYRDGDRLAKIPSAFLFAVTATTVHVFEIKMFMGNTKIKKEIAAFDRAGLELGTQEDTLVITYLMVAPNQRQEMMFEIMKSDYARDFATLVRTG